MKVEPVERCRAKPHKLRCQKADSEVKAFGFKEKRDLRPNGASQFADLSLCCFSSRSSHHNLVVAVDFKGDMY